MTDVLAVFGDDMQKKYKTIVADPPWPIGDFPAWFREDRRSVKEIEIGMNRSTGSSWSRRGFPVNATQRDARYSARISRSAAHLADLVQIKEDQHK